MIKISIEENGIIEINGEKLEGFSLNENNVLVDRNGEIVTDVKIDENGNILNSNGEILILGKKNEEL